MTFAEAVEYLDSLQRRKWREGLGRMRELLRILGLAEFVWGDERPAYIHVAGTNGKGSVCAFLQGLMAAEGVRGGTAASPYVYDVRERVQLGRSLIPHADFARLVARLAETDDVLGPTEYGPASAFEMKTALAFLYWQEQGVEAAALEVGIGGRLDATNTAETRACVIASIGWDHMELLGDTLAKIAGEKAGIFKPGVPAVAGRLPQEAMEAVQARARELGCPLWRVGEEIQIRKDGPFFSVEAPGFRWEGLRTRMKGRVQRDNAALALAGMALAGLPPTAAQAEEGVGQASWPGRFEELQWRGRPLILDGAHNLPAAQNLCLNLEEAYHGQRIGIVVGMLKGHDPRGFLDAFSPLRPEIRLVSSPGSRGVSAEDLAEAGFGTPASTMEEALESLADCGVLCVTGSFYILGEAKEAALAGVSP